MDSITVTVPLEYFALTRASDMLHGMALDLENQGKALGRRDDDKPVSDRPTRTDAEAAFSRPPYEPDPSQVEEAERYAKDVHEQEEKDAAAVFGSQPGKPPVSGASDSSTPAGTAAAPDTAHGATTTATPAATAGTPAPASSAAGAAETPSDSPNEPTGQPAPGAASPGTASEATGTSGVELDSDGLPWDSRIHAGSKGKLAKTKQWKKKRNVDPEVVKEVEAELRAAMSASPANPVEPKPTPAPASAPAASETPAPPATTPASPTPTPPPAATGAITSFPALMQKITAAGIPQATVTAAVNKQGLQALPLLAARPDLIPAVAAELFPGG